MAELIIEAGKIKSNIKQLSEYFKDKGVQWSLITKVFSGDMEFLKHVLSEDVIENVYSVGDSRLTSLKNLKKVNPNMRTIYIKPPAKMYAADVVAYADVSLNSSFSTILALNEAAKNLGVVHQIIIMVELGELREGIQRSDIMSFYEQVFELSNIEVVGIGSNLGCMYGVEPNYDKLLQLVLYKELISVKFNKQLDLVSGGTSITLPLLDNKALPKEINHFRVGEAAFFGISPLNNVSFNGLYTDTFRFKANIIELEEKKLIPDGIISEANIGQTANIDLEDKDDTSVKAILDFGLLDVDHKNLEALDDGLDFVGITSDMMVLDLGNNLDDKGNTRYKVGDKITFTANYMAVARLLNSKFIDKVFIN